MGIPLATYRLQLQPDFGFADTAGIVAYLAELGVSHIYASPIFRARPGSRHGYDCVDPGEFNPELGSAADWQALGEQRRKNDLGWLQDIVPNHMAFDSGNRMLMDVLENGTRSCFRNLFDIDWEHPDSRLQGRLMAPFLGRPYSECLQDGEILLAYAREGFGVQYFDLEFPLRIESYHGLLCPRTETLVRAAGADSEPIDGFERLLDQLAQSAAGPVHLNFADETRSLKQTLWKLCEHHPAVRRIVDDILRVYNAPGGGVRPFEDLDRLLSEQRFRLCHWKRAGRQINYRRFFDINHLIALRQETETACDQTHGLVTRLVRSGEIDGVRVDHVDGLADPAAYLARLRGRVGEVPILVEKIMEADEALPEAWPVQGTSGYDYAALLNAVFVDPANEDRFSRIYTEFCGPMPPFGDTVVDAKYRVLETQLGGDLDNLARRLMRTAGGQSIADPASEHRLKSALKGLLCRFPVYRTYIDASGATEIDRRRVQQAFEACLPHLPALREELEWIRRILLGETEEGDGTGESFIAHFQQLTATLTAKGLEDTALYVYNRFVALNDVGSDPRRFGCGVDDFHAAVRRRSSRHPHGMVGTATHDSKRGEDVRARLNVLSEMPVEWRRRVWKWHALNRGHRSRKGRGAPDKNEEYLFYQTLIGAWPFDDRRRPAFVERIRDYMVKAAREAKVHTNWVAPCEEHEAELAAFVERVLDPSTVNAFPNAFLPFCRKVARLGAFNSLSQLVLKITLPGFPDIYQGSELPDLNLVDPDNRRPVDFFKRAEMLRDIRKRLRTDPAALVDALLQNVHDGGLKIYTLAAALAARKDFVELFRDGTYLPLTTVGVHRRRLVAFARAHRRAWSVTIAPRFLSGLVVDDRPPVGREVWGETEVVLPPGTPTQWDQIFSRQTVTGGERIRVGDALRHFPCAVLVAGRGE
jgi:(1->4)-alpha-D-glucan 1-alpha-D-glucosylmutase